jgi:hypothetical protein
MSVQKLFESTIYRKAFDSLETSERQDANWGWDRKNTKRWPLDVQARMDNWLEVTNRLKFIRGNLTRAANRGEYSKDIAVSLDYVYGIGESQNWKCALTGLPLEFERGGTEWGGKWCNPNSCTIDRIDSSKGYVKGNIQLVLWKVNCIKRDLKDDEFIEICKQVVQNCR